MSKIDARGYLFFNFKLGVHCVLEFRAPDCDTTLCDAMYMCCKSSHAVCLQYHFTLPAAKLTHALQAGLADITQSLKNYRPSVTVLEAQVAPSRRGEGAGGTGAPGLTAANSPDGGLVAVMEQKRHAHDQAIQVNKITAATLEHFCHIEMVSTPACSHLTHVCVGSRHVYMTPHMCRSVLCVHVC